MSTQKNLITLCFATVFTLGLAACGGGGGGGGGGDAPVTDMTDIGAISEESAAEAAAKVVAATAAAATKRTEIAEEASETGAADAGLGGTGAMIGVAVGNYELSIKRDSTATTVTVTVHGETDDDDVEFMQADFGDGRTMHTREMEADADGNVMTEVVIVSTDIEAPKATAFATEYPFDANPKTGGADFQSILIVSDGATPNLAMIATDGITAVGSGSITVKAAVEADDATAVAAFETDATFDGAPGTLKCAGIENCTVTFDAEGEITAFVGVWQFTPADGATVDVDDIDYLHYGFWLKKTTDKDGADTYTEVETFAGSSVDPER